VTWTDSDVAAYYARLAAEGIQLAGQDNLSPPPPMASAGANGGHTGHKNKYGAVRTNGYASKKEADYAAGLELAQKAGQIAFWLEQVPLRLPGGSKYLLDFVVFTWNKGMRSEDRQGAWDIEFVEVKGKDLPIGKLKRKQAEEIYGIYIEVV
jgi:hypothetical protein